MSTHRDSRLCLIFDLDGTLIDSEPLCSQAFLDVLPDLSDTPAGLMSRYRGHRMADVFEDLSRRVGRPLDDKLRREYSRRVDDLYETHLEPMPGVGEALAALRHPFCVASNGPPTKIERGLRVTALSGFFHGKAFSAYDVGSWKPEPHLFLHAAGRMGYSPDECVVIEDSDAGLLAAEAAGMNAIHFRHTGPASTIASIASMVHFRELQAILAGIAREIVAR